MIRVVHPVSRIRILTFYPSLIPDPGVKKAPDPGSGSATLEFYFDPSIIIKTKSTEIKPSHSEVKGESSIISESTRLTSKQSSLEFIIAFIRYISLKLIIMLISMSCLFYGPARPWERRSKSTLRKLCILTVLRKGRKKFHI
jgi:hypothetical protein